MTDPIGAMLNMLKNAGNAERPFIVVPYSKMKEAVATCLNTHGYAGSISKKVKKGVPSLEIEVMYNENGTPRIKDVSRISKPSRRMYTGYKELKSYKNGHGMSVLSTPKGILADKDARKELVGGEVLFKIS